MNAEENPGYYLPEEDDMAIAVNTSVYALLDSVFSPDGSPEDRPVLVDTQSVQSQRPISDLSKDF